MTLNPEEKRRFKRSLVPILFFVILIWVVKGIEVGLNLDFGQYGNYPRTLAGSVGIITSPLIHADFQHLISNSFPLIFLGVGLFYFYPKIAWRSVTIIYLLSGFWVWLAARDAYHIGASGLVYGFMAFLLLSGFLRKDRVSLAMSFIVLVLYGGSLFIGVLPGHPGISWESQLVGAIAGLFCAIFFRKSSINSFSPESTSDDNLEIEYKYTYKPMHKDDSEERSYVHRVDLNKSNEKEQASE